MLDEADEPFLAHRIEELLDVGVEYPVHLSGCYSHHQRVHRVMRAAPRSEPIAEAEEIFLVRSAFSAVVVARWTILGSSPRTSLVLQRGDRQRALPSIRLGDID
jgi:hypothetical protein